MKPPFRITSAITDACTRIERLIGRCEGRSHGALPAPQLRRANRIRTVHATTAIEGNGLSLDQVTAILDGKHVRGSPREIREVSNALAAYERASKLDPRAERSLLRAHATFMDGLASDAGRYRARSVGILRGSRVLHVAPPADRVPALMHDLFAFARARDATPALVKACVLHYGLEFIHPFSDGNGRVGRWWQYVLWADYSPVLAHVSVESMIKAHQKAYYSALSRSDRVGDATGFVVFMLEQLERALEAFVVQLAPARSTPESRLALALVNFRGRSFSRRDYLTLHPGISTATASRDLNAGVCRRALRATGDKATARYSVCRVSSRG